MRFLLAIFPVGICLAILAVSMPAQSPSSKTPSVAQVTGGDSAIGCPGPAGTFFDTDLSLTFRSSGNPVIITFTGIANMSTNTGISMRPAIDGQELDRMAVSHYIGEGELAPLSFTRAYAVNKGIHTYRVQFSCQGDVSVAQRWMTVFEVN